MFASTPDRNFKLAKLSVVINVKNMADLLPACLESVSFANEIIVVDMESTDNSVKIAKNYTDKVFSHPDVGYVEPARNFALAKAKFDWILVLDADEIISPSLKDKILELLAGPQADIYWLSRQNFVFGAWLNKAGWWPDHQPRLFRQGAVSWRTDMHRMPDMIGQQIKLPPKPEWAIQHQNYVSIEQFVDKLNNYTSIQANELMTADPQAGLTASQVVTPLKAYFAELLRRLLAERGLDAGLHGVSAAFLQANYELIKQLKLWQAANFPPTHDDQPETIGALRQFQSELNYWLADWQLEHAQGLAKIYWWLRRKFRC